MRRSPRNARRGSVLVLSVFMMTVMIAVMAFGVDMGYVLMTKAELQNVADFAALAGGSQLLDRDLLTGSTSTSGQVTGAFAEAQEFAELNKAGGKTISLASNSGNSLEGDVAVGYIANPSDLTSAMTKAVTPYNAVKVTARRSSSLNGSLPLFFAKIFGQQNTNVSASATAILEGKIRGFSVTSNSGVSHSKLLPFAMHVSVWSDVTNGVGPDVWDYDPEDKTVSAGSDYIKEAKLYGAKTSSPGNFGTVNIGAPNNSTNDIARQILYGPNEEDFEYLGGALTLGPDGTVVLSGDPGLSAGFKDELTAIIGQERIVPLYTTLTGNGANSKFTVVGFAGLILTHVKLTGGDKAVTIQPEFVIDGSAMRGDVGSISGYIYQPLRLAR